jgi:hypothetical protein
MFQIHRIINKSYSGHGISLISPVAASILAELAYWGNEKNLISGVISLTTIIFQIDNVTNVFHKADCPLIGHLYRLDTTKKK